MVHTLVTVRPGAKPEARPSIIVAVEMAADYPRSVRSLRRTLHRLRPRRQRPSERAALALSLIVLVLGTTWSILDNNNQVKVAGVIIIVIVLSSLLLSMRGMLALAGGVVVCLAVVFRIHGLNPSQLSISGFVMVGTTLFVGIVQAGRRDRLGLRQVSAEKVIAQIRDRLLVQAQLPTVPDGWSVEIEQRPAQGAAIAGDFVSSRVVCDGESRVLHLAVIDVSGNGIAAGPRALLLSGAVGGLLGSVEPDQFLAAANDYLHRQHWSLGFASAVYVRLDLTTGEYGIRVAGHPPAVHFRPGQTPPWRTSPAAGTVLGVLPTLAGVSDLEVLRPGEALFLYTDGVVEDRTRDIDAGTLRFKDAVEELAARSRWRGVSEHLVERIPATHDDDRTVVMIRRHADVESRARVTVPVAVPSRSRPADPLQ
jgi:serine phosphatase RsbU (regulator of sigma subunit)